MMADCILILGRRGQLARAVAQHAKAANLSALCLGREELDLTMDGVATRLKDVSPWAVINTSAFTAVDAAESSPHEAEALNGTAPGRLARVCADLDIPLVHVSTDYVFDGKKGLPYVEADGPAPLNMYGRSKLSGEKAVHSVGGRSTIFRTSALLSAAGANFFTTLLRLARTRDRISVVNDQVTCPTLADDLAEALVSAASRLREGGAVRSLYHFAGQTAVSWDRLATEIFECSRRRGGPIAVVTPISSAEYGAPATRPADSRLDSSLAQEDFGLAGRPWEAGLERLFQQYWKGES